MRHVTVSKRKGAGVLHTAKAHQRIVAVHLQLQRPPEQSLAITSTETANGSTTMTDKRTAYSLGSCQLASIRKTSTTQRGNESRRTRGVDACGCEKACTNLGSPLRAVLVLQVSVGQAAAQIRIRLEGAQRYLQVRHSWGHKRTHTRAQTCKHTPSPIALNTPSNSSTSNSSSTHAQVCIRRMLRLSSSCTYLKRSCPCGSAGTLCFDVPQEPAN